MFFKSYIGAVSIIAAFFLSFSLCYAGTDLPLGSRIYPLLNELQIGGLINSHLTGTRPITTGEARRLLEEADEGLYRGEGEGVAPYLTNALEDAEKIVALGLGDQMLQLKPLARPEIRYIYLQGEESTIPGMNASQHSLVYNNDGVEPAEGSNGYLSFEVEGRTGPIFFNATPLFSLDGAARGALHRGYVKLSALGLDLQAGKIPLWWGQGDHGTLILSNNAEPLHLGEQRIAVDLHHARREVAVPVGLVENA